MQDIIKSILLPHSLREIVFSSISSVGKVLSFKSRTFDLVDFFGSCFLEDISANKKDECFLVLDIWTKVSATISFALLFFKMKKFYKKVLKFYLLRNGLIFYFYTYANVYNAN